MSKFSEVIESTTDELKNKVTWPTWQELQSSTVLVMVATLILSVVIGIIDLVGSQLINLLYSLS
ncbi:MAG: preprotein translocase subunit SecE [Bacteroidota bacterium]|nr:preprotein translocase subunit SecE [Bacteroidota bacterium]